FNDTAKALPEQSCPQLQHEDFTSEALEQRCNQPLWMIEKARPDAEGKTFLWAEEPKVSLGMDLLLWINRADEEILIVQREISRACNWVLEYAGALHNSLAEMPELSEPYLSSLCLDCILILENATTIDPCLF
ncbi:hypothetical protein MMC09_000217, partial [Bachmanniomyces sp. S44760]|nr:hypothetical protein [Bachmanniomyces sp. S44760]